MNAQLAGTLYNMKCVAVLLICPHKVTYTCIHNKGLGKLLLCARERSHVLQPEGGERPNGANPQFVVDDQPHLFMQAAAVVQPHSPPRGIALMTSCHVLPGIT